MLVTEKPVLFSVHSSFHVYLYRSMLEPHCKEDPKLKELIEVLLDWINDELAEYRIIVKDVEEDFYDGQVLQVSPCKKI